MAEHAFLSASGSKIWLSCPPSARLSEKFPDTASFSASEGTFAHALAELELRFHFGEFSHWDYKQKLKEMKSGEFYSNALVEYVEEYVQMVIEKFHAIWGKDRCTKLFIEQKLDFSRWVPDGFGTGDAVIVGNHTVEVCDLKYGKHVPVIATNNPQLRLYALGVYDEFDWLEDINKIRMTICQPRNGGVSSEELTADQLLAWGEKVKPIAQQAMMGEGVTKAGEHCRFCGAAPQCRALAEYQLQIARYEFRNEQLLSDEEIADILDKVDGLVSYANKVKAYALAEALNGRKWPGYKVVEGTSRRKISDADKVVKTLIEHGIEEDRLYKPKELLGLTDLTSLLGQKNFKEWLSKYIVKPQGKPALVPESDKRPEFSSAENDFEKLD